MKTLHPCKQDRRYTGSTDNFNLYVNGELKATASRNDGDTRYRRQ